MPHATARRSRIRGAAALLGGAALFVAAGAAVLYWPVPPLDRAARAIDEGRLDDAERLIYPLAVENDPRALALLAGLRLRQGRPDSALAIAGSDRAALTAPDRAALSGEALLALGRFVEARDALTVAARGRHDDPAVLGPLASATYRAEGPAAARPIYARLEALQPARHDWPRALGLIELETDRYEAAAAAFGRALEHAPDDIDTRFSLAEADYLRGAVAPALANLDRCLAARPDDPRFTPARAECLRALGRTPEAAAALDEFLADRPDDPRALRLRAECHIEAGDPAAAAALLERAEARDPNDWRVHYQLALAYRRLGRADDAEAQAEKARAGRDRSRQAY